MQLANNCDTITMLQNKSLHSRISPFHVIILLVLLQLFFALFTFTLTLTHEESMWHYIGRNWLRHEFTPYEGGVDNKSPLIFIIFGISDNLFGVNYWFPRLAGTFVEALGMYYIYRIARHLVSHQAGIFTMSVYGLALLWKVTGGKLVSFTETYATACIIYSFYKALTAEKNKDFLISGVFAGLAIAFRISALFSVIAILVLCIKKKRASVILFSGALMGSCAILLISAIIAGIHPGKMLGHMVLENYGTGSITDHTIGWKIKGFINNFILSELVLFAPFVIGYILIKKKVDALVIWFVCTFIGINFLGIYARPHFKELLPSLSLMSGLVLTYLCANFSISFKRFLIITWIFFFPKNIEPYWGIKKWLYPPAIDSEVYCKEGTIQATEEAEKQLGLWIKANTKETDRVYVAGFGARVQVFSERLSPTIYFNVTQTDLAIRTIYTDLHQNPPEMLVIPVFENYRKYVQSNIRLFIDDLAKDQYTFRQCLYGYNIYNLKTTTPLSR